MTCPARRWPSLAGTSIRSISLRTRLELQRCFCWISDRCALSRPPGGLHEWRASSPTGNSTGSDSAEFRVDQTIAQTSGANGFFELNGLTPTLRRDRLRQNVIGRGVKGAGKRPRNPESAKSRRAPNSEDRGIPESGTTNIEDRRAALAAQGGCSGTGAPRPCRLQQFRPSGFRAVRNSAVFGISRSSGLRALPVIRIWHSLNRATRVPARALHPGMPRITLGQFCLARHVECGAAPIAL